MSSFFVPFVEGQVLSEDGDLHNAGAVAVKRMLELSKGWSIAGRALGKIYVLGT